MTEATSNSGSTTKFLESFSVLRLVVGYLGERSRGGWWQTDLLGDTGIRFLSTTFPRTAKLAALNTASEAAQLVHDHAIGRAGFYHLFRFPPDLEEMVGTVQSRMDWESQWKLIESQKTALAALEGMAEALIQAPDGPMQIGVESKILKRAAVNEMAAHYCSSFRQGNRCFPYFGKG